MADKLKPCPFCGAQPKLEDLRLRWRVVCECGATVLGDKSDEPENEEHAEKINWNYFEQSAVDRWNRRAGGITS